MSFNQHVDWKHIFFTHNLMHCVVGSMNYILTYSEIGNYQLDSFIHFLETAQFLADRPNLSYCIL